MSSEKKLSPEVTEVIYAQSLGHSFYHRAVEYYILTRFSFKHHLVHSVGYVAHQSLEHLIKGGLAEVGYSSRQIKSLNHPLDDLLREVAEIRAISLDILPRIREIETWYKLRYPSLADKPFALTTSIKREEKLTKPQPLTGEAPMNFPLNLEEVDEAFANLAKELNWSVIAWLLNQPSWEEIYTWKNEHTFTESN